MADSISITPVGGGGSSSTGGSSGGSPLLGTEQSTPGAAPLNPDSISTSQRAASCSSQLSSCKTLCGGDARTNTCDTATLEFACTCSDGKTPPLEKYAGTMPSFIAAEQLKLCLARATQSTNPSAEICNATFQPGNLFPESVKTTASKTTTVPNETGDFSIQTSPPNPTSSLSTTNSARTTSSNTSSSTPTTSQSSIPNPLPANTADNGLSTGTKAGIGVGAGLAVVIIAILCFLLWRKSRAGRVKKVDDKEDMGGKAELPGEDRALFELGESEKKKAELEARERAELEAGEVRRRAELEAEATRPRYELAAGR